MPISTTLDTSRVSSLGAPGCGHSPRSSRASMTWPTISRRGQVAHQLLRAGVAEGTGQRAADLAGNAQRAAPFLGDVDRLDLVPARDAHQVLAGAVGADLAADDLAAARS